MPMSPRLLRPRATGFNPRSISGLSGWLDAADAASVTLNAGNVSQINDKSGNNRNATQTIAANQPLYRLAAQNGKNTIRFDGQNDDLSCTIPLASSITLFFVTTPSTQNDSYLMRGSSSGSSPGILSRYTNGASRRDYEWWSGNGADRLILATTQAGFSLITVTHTDGGSVTGFINGTQTVTKATAAATISGVNYTGIGSAGGAAFSSADFAELLIYTRVLSDSERKRVTDYIGKKWGITVA